MFNIKKPLFAMECLARVISGVFKAGVVDVKSDYRSLDT